jgi:hypothetical protein
MGDAMDFRLFRCFVLVALKAVAACASVKPGHDAAGRMDQGNTAGGGEQQTPDIRPNRGSRAGQSCSESNYRHIWG